MEFRTARRAQRMITLRAQAQRSRPSLRALTPSLFLAALKWLRGAEKREPTQLVAG